MKVKRIFAFTLITTLAAATFLFITALAAGNIVVTPTDTPGWATADTRPGGATTYVVDNTAPSGIGALKLTTDGTTAAKAQYLHGANTPLSSVTELSYWTKQNSASFSGADPSYQLPVCLGGVETPT